MIFTGSMPPFHITQPSTDNDIQIVAPTATMATLTCSLNVTIPSDAVVFWTHNNTLIPINQVSRVCSTTTLTIENPRSSDAGIYQCVFNDVANTGWVLSRIVRLYITGMYGTKSHICIYLQDVYLMMCRGVGQCLF